MAKEKETVSRDDDEVLLPVKIRRSDIRALKMVASWRDQTITEYLAEVLAESAKLAGDLQQVAGGIRSLLSDKGKEQK